MDVIGVLLVLVISFALGFHKTIRQDLPIGIFSTFGAAGSMMVTRLVTKRNNIGNLIGLLTAVNSAFVDYYLGNDAALLTYPISPVYPTCIGKEERIAYLEKSMQFTLLTLALPLCWESL
jgi:hypothetical protein